MRRENIGQFISYETIRKTRQMVDEFELAQLAVGHRFADQAFRTIGRLHTNTPNSRCEMDYCKYGRFLYPHEHWSDEPLFYQDGLAVDDFSNVITGQTITTSPSSADLVRLFRSTVLPKSLTLPVSLKHLAQQWDAFGVPELVAIDNGSDFRSALSLLMYFFLGVIVLLLPVQRGDFKGTIERLHGTLLTRWIASRTGYVPAKWKFTDPRHQRLIKQAKQKANATVADHRKEKIEMILTYNHEKDTRFGKPRIQLLRDAYDVAPPLLPTGRLQCRALFSLTYPSVLTKEGVEVAGGIKYNSPALNDLFRVHPTGKAHTKVEPDDLRSALVFAEGVDSPVEVHLSTYRIDFPLSFELLRIIQRRLKGQGYPDDAWRDNDYALVYEEAHSLQSGPRKPVTGVSQRQDAQAATHAAEIPSIPKPGSVNAMADLEALLNSTKPNEP